MSTDIVIVSAARTGVGKFGGSLAKVSASALGSVVIAEVLKRAGLTGEHVSEVIMGHVVGDRVGLDPGHRFSLARRTRPAVRWS